MKTIIAGSRSITNPILIERAVCESGFEITEVFSGMARGADRLGELWALLNFVPVRRFSADWKRYGKAAGPIRNQEMADQADALVAVWDGKSGGTADMIRRARGKGLKVFVLTVEG